MWSRKYASSYELTTKIAILSSLDISASITIIGDFTKGATKTTTMTRVIKDSVLVTVPSMKKVKIALSMQMDDEANIQFKATFKKLEWDVITGLPIESLVHANGTWIGSLMRNTYVSVKESPATWLDWLLVRI